MRCVTYLHNGEVNEFRTCLHVRLHDDLGELCCVSRSGPQTCSEYQITKCCLLPKIQSIIIVNYVGVVSKKL